VTAEKIPSWFERLLLPRLSEISGEIRALDTKIDSLRNETKTEIEGLRKEIESNRKEMLSKFEGVDHRFEAIDIKITSLRTEMIVRLDSLEKRIPVIEEITAQTQNC